MMSKAVIAGPNDPRHFSIATPKQVASAYLRIMDPTTGVAPSPNRIVKDIKKVFANCIVIFNKKGAYVPSLATQTGNRKMDGKNNFSCGGKREARKLNFWNVVKEGDKDDDEIEESKKWDSSCGSKVGGLHEELEVTMVAADLSAARGNYFEQKISSRNICKA